METRAGGGSRLPRQTSLHRLRHKGLNGTSDDLGGTWDIYINIYLWKETLTFKMAAGAEAAAQLP